jgi:hypothetical protein
MVKLKVMKYLLKTLIILFPIILNASEIRGYVVGQIRAQTPTLKDNPRSFGTLALENINRINYFNEMNKFQFEIGLEFNQILQWTHDPLQERNFEKTNTPYRLEDFRPTVLTSKSGINSYYLLKQLDRLQLHYSFYSFDITLGRQQISFGSAKLVNPTDVFTPFSPTTINTEEKNGVDALRIKKTFGPNTEAEIGILFGNKFKEENSALFIRSIFSYKELEIKPILLSYREALGVGIDFLVPYKGAHFYIESLSTFIDKKNFHSYNRTTAGIEYQWSNDLFFVVEYHYNGDGRGDTTEYDLKGLSFSRSRGSSFYLARHYFNFMLNYQLTPLHILTLTSYQNLNDGSNLFAPSWSWSFSENSTLGFGLFIGVGKETNNPFQVKSEFGSYGKQFFSKYTYYF